MRLGAVTALAVTCSLATPSPARAQIGSERYSAIVTEARSGNILIAASPDEQRYPASLTKMMTVYMAFEALRDGRSTLDSTIRVSSNAASMAPSRLGLTPGMSLTVEEAILALVTKSANDAAAALGEHLGGGSEERFAQMMTLKARALGMTRTTFRNASGLPDPDQTTTARDMALLGRRLMQDFPERYAFFSTPHFVFRGRTHWNHNRLLQEYEGADGIKTGYVNDSGFNLVASAQRDGVRLIAAVFGGQTGRERDRHMMALLDQGFSQMGVSPMARRNLPTMMASAHAASLAQARAGRRLLAASAPAPAARVAATSRPVLRLTAAPVRVQPAARPPLLRNVTTRAPRITARMEQGDAGGRASVAAPRSAKVAPIRPANAAPAPTTRHAKRAR
ncbi:D-alanyl-D-alanine carboxypeptidase family protein [Belnapia mucosa]|nr:D-alanyl-D-alanine carboxypeptidase family protein [Belnapia mucosa]